MEQRWTNAQNTEEIYMTNNQAWLKGNFDISSLSFETLRRHGPLTKSYIRMNEPKEGKQFLLPTVR